MAETAQMIKIPGTHPSVFRTVGRPNTPIPMVDLIPMILARNLLVSRCIYLIIQALCFCTLVTTVNLPTDASADRNCPRHKQKRTRAYLES